MHGDAGPEVTLARYRGLGPAVVVVKNGGGRIWAWDRSEGMVSHDPARVEPVDSTAAGDSFNAGFLAARFGGAGLSDSLAAGAALAGRVIRHPGALME